MIPNMNLHEIVTNVSICMMHRGLIAGVFMFLTLI